MNLETKELDLNVVGKDGLTRAYKIQRHTPTAPMCFIRTVTGHMLFCQEDHPVWIQSLDGQPTVVEAKDIVMFHDRIWVDNTERKLEFVYGVEPPDVDILFDILLNIFEDPNLHIIANHSEYFNGDSIYNFCINPDYLSKISTSNLTYLLYHFLFDNIKSDDKVNTKSKIFSFNFVSQLKLVADHLSHTCNFDINTEDGLVYWTLKNAVPSDKLIQDINDYIDIEQVVPGIEGYCGYVYDLKTDSEEFLNNNVQTHNSFHTGGAVVFKKVDILKELADSITDDEEKYLSGMVYQKDNDLYSSAEVTTIKINKSIFKDEYAIEKVGNTYKLPLGYFRMYIGNIEVNATIEMPVEINIHDDYNETADSITLMYGKDVKLFTIKFFKIAPEKIAQSLDSLVAGKGPWETPENLYKKFYEALSTFGPWDSCHLEVILATILRNKKDPMIAARLKDPYDPELHSIKSLPSIISWSLGVAYENLGKSLTFGLISKDSKKYSQIEKVLFGEPLSELSIEKLKEKKK
jgi:hypothetical protein